MQQQAQLFSPLLAPPTTGSPWLASRLLRRQVVNVATLDQVGRVADVAFDWRLGQLTGLRIQRDTPPRGLAAAIGRVFRRNGASEMARLDQVIALNGDVVMIDTESTGSSAPPPPQHAAYLNEVCELAILTTYGACLGSLADLLLDQRGDTILGYVIEPTALAEEVAPLLDEMIAPEPPSTAGEVNTSGAGADIPTTSRLRVIPVSANIRFGDALILLVAQVEPLRRAEVVITRALDAPEPVDVVDEASAPVAVETLDAQAAPEPVDAVEAPAESLRTSR